MGSSPTADIMTIAAAHMPITGMQNELVWISHQRTRQLVATSHLLAAADGCMLCQDKQSSGTWCSGITSASHAEGPGFKSQCVHFLSLL